MSTLQNSLRCLVHPITLLSIGLLLVNDHVLKVTSPSWLTGKLSDFAGLFFFPFLLAIALGFVFRRGSHKTIGWLAFGITAIWFALIKTTTWGNGLTEEFVSRLVGVPVQIVLDPTDLIALSVLYPAWRLWNRAEQARPTRLGWIALGVASLATLATSPLPPLPAVTSVASQDSKAYVLSYDSVPYAMSTDGGQTWTRVTSLPRINGHEVKMPMVLCDSPQTKICYRIASREQVEASGDGGQTWHVAWSIPIGRREFMARASHCALTMAERCYGEMNLGPFDMTLSEPVGRNGLHTLIVALGTNGVLVRDPDGNWQMNRVLEVKPFQFAAQNFGEAQSVLRTEMELWIILALIILISVSLLSIRMILPTNRGLGDDEGSWQWAIRPIIRLVCLVLIAFLAAYLGNGYLFGNFGISAYLSTIFEWFSPIGYSLVLILVIGVFLAWKRIVNKSKAEVITRFAWFCFLISILVFVFGYGSLMLWAFGTIAEYQTALIISFIASMSVLALGVLLIYKQSQIMFARKIES
ncbi:MAG: hypothetical protein HZB51_21705 [Chloroflexi bacterium]|nr:hypothetical protein [Chloroflexota bacterium]